jgi:hypothetical protein
VSAEFVNVEVNGVAVKAPKGEMIIRVTDAHGAYIPRFCYHDKLPIAAYALRHLTTEQRKSVRDAVGIAPSDSLSRAVGGYAEVGALLPTSVALDGMQPLPRAVVDKIPEMRGVSFTESEGKLLLVNPRNRRVLAVL